MRFTNRCAAMLIACLAAGPALGQSFPGRIIDGLVGDWNCGDARLYITKLGSIEVLEDGYRAGLYDAADAVLAIQWDEGGREDWGYTVDQGSMTLTTTAAEKTYSCEPRAK